MGRPIGIGFLLIFLSLFFFSLLIQTGRASSQNDQEFEGPAAAAAAARTLKQEQEHPQEVHCSRERSRAAWKIIEEYLMPFVEQEQYQISTRCRLHADNDLFRDQEQHKVHMDINEWQCGYCKKSFRAEKFLDQHFDNRHYNLLNISHSKCLADLCGALHCDLVMDSKPPKTKCNPAAASRNRHLCEVASDNYIACILNSHTCLYSVVLMQSLADNCFPINAGPSASRLHELFLRQFCDSHSCTGGRKPFSRGGKKQTSVFYLAISILTLMLLPIFYVIVYLYSREMKTGVQDLKRISKTRHKTKPS
ncbi:hypothetical protein BVC80_1065g54 [Macleaya cordata]|uniref:C2H2-type domain-containing protein n=1 Tax=Macleaya cordata TaxID=56857 RepID=A0A200RCU7_MACCD|nr:hypothetical protein BVC80_1065g54 [Macleaya cordata]